MAMPAWAEEQGGLLRQNKNLVETSPMTALLDLAASTIDLDYFLEHEEEFDELPDDLIEHMLSLPSCKLRLPEYFHLVVKAGRRSIKIPCYPLPEEEVEWTTDKLNSTMDLIIEKCPPGSLEKFSISTPYSPYLEECIPHKFGIHDAETVYPEPDVERLQHLLRNQPRLKEIYLEPSNSGSSETVCIIGQTCHDLRSLSLGCRSIDADIDLDTMRQLVDGCPLLQKFLCAEERIQEEAVMYALQHLKYLIYIPVSMQNIIKFCQSGGILPPSFRPDISFGEQSDFDNGFLIQNLCPKVSDLSINPHEDVDLDLTQLKFKSVRTLWITDIKAHNIPQLEPFLQMCGSEITQLCLYGCDKDWNSSHGLDLSIVMEHCPIILEILISKIPISKSFKCSVTANKVKFLRCLCLELEPACTSPDDFLYPIICNGVLEHLTVRALSPRLLTRLTHEMRAAVADARPSPVFPKLTCLDVETVGQEKLTFEEAVALVTLAPRLQLVKFNSLAAGIKDNVQLFLDTFAPPVFYSLGN